LVRALQRAGFERVRQKGSHVLMRHGTDASRRCIVAVHGGAPIPPGTLREILRGSGLTVDELRDLL
jgi:predicted RNA binding protein YcfA (HicA-like mRNA interferase family)